MVCTGKPTDPSGSTPRAAALFFPPLQKFAEQRLTLFLRQVCGCGTGIFQKRRKIARYLRLRLLWANAPQHLFRRSPAIPARHRGGKKWLSLNAEYAKIWPNITVKKAPPPDSKEWEGKPDKLQYFSPNPGAGD